MGNRKHGKQVPSPRQRCPNCGAPDGKLHKDSCPLGRCTRCGKPRQVARLRSDCDAEVQEIAEKPW